MHRKGIVLAFRARPYPIIHAAPNSQRACKATVRPLHGSSSLPPSSIPLWLFRVSQAKISALDENWPTNDPLGHCATFSCCGTIVQMDKRPTVNEELYYQMVKAAAERKMSVKSWLEEAIREKLERQTEKAE